jgi:D-beta-D-heptose 7-phosphate kinase/D-beta-D-heptose 1-phosphate adenosyltransferase
MREFKNLHVLVVGDLFLDEYIEGEMYEISKEGPFPVIRIESKTQTAGAAGNLASSIRNLGAKVSMVGIVGDDPNGKVLLSQLREKGIGVGGVVSCPDNPTLTYSKVRARVENTPSKEILRIDVLPAGPLHSRREVEILRNVESEASGVNAIIVLDQVHHLITKTFLDAVPRIARKKGALLHGSSRDHLVGFRSFDLITPNDREAEGATGGAAGSLGSLDGVERMGRALQKKGGHKKVLLTLGPRGMMTFPERGPVEEIPTYARNVVDVTGAGDAVSSVAVLGNILGWDLGSLAWAASQAAALAVEHVGTHHVSSSELAERILDEE